MEQKAVGHGRNMRFEGQHFGEDVWDRSNRLALVKECDALRSELADHHADAKRYRWLRECSPVSSAHMAVTVNCPEYRKGQLINGARCLDGEALDRFIDARLVVPNVELCGPRRPAQEHANGTK